MGVFEKIFGKRRTPAQASGQAFRLLEGYTHAFTTWQGSIFESDLIRAALDAHGRHMVPTTITEAPATGAPVGSVTLPRTVSCPFWANPATDPATLLAK